MLTTAPDEVAVTPIADKLLSAFIAAASPAAIEVKVSVDRTVYVSDSEPELKLESKAVRVRTSPVDLVPPTTATCQPYVGVVNERDSVEPLL
jgi:hypothetical protein